MKEKEVRIKIIDLSEITIPIFGIKDIFPIKLKIKPVEKEITALIAKNIEEKEKGNEILSTLRDVIKRKKNENNNERYLLFIDKKIRYRNKEIFGISEFNGNSLVSTYLLYNKTDKEKAEENDQNKEEDVIKVIAHEIGHGIGLNHCKTKGCIMQKIDKIEDLESQREELCNSCKEKLVKKWKMI